MMPGAGLYLPETSHRVHSTRTEYKVQTSAPTKTQKYFQRISPKQSQDSERQSSTLSRKSSEDVARVFSSLPTVFDFADFASTQTKVPSDSQVFVNLIQRVRQDVTEASRLYTTHAVTDYLESWPDKKTWIDTVLLDIQRALNDIGVHVEAVRVSGGDDGSPASLRRKFEWVLSHHKKLISKQQFLTLCHQSLMATVQLMQAAEINNAFAGQDPAVHEAPARPWTNRNQDGVMRSPHSRQRLRHSSKNLSLPSITVSEVDGSKIEVPSINSVLVELPGSTPEDLPDPQNWDLYAPPRARSLSVGDPPTSPTIPISPTSPHSIKQNAVFSPLTVDPPQAWPERSSSRAPANGTPTRKFFDQVRPLPTASVLMRPHTSATQRPRAYSDEVQQFEQKARASFDHHTRPMPTVTEKPLEKPLERYDTTSTVHVSDASTVPVSAKRFRPKEVNVQKTLSKANSLPNELPYVSSTGSLMDELAQWVLPPGAHTSIHSADTTGSLSTATPATSTGSSPISPEQAVNDSCVLQDPTLLVTSPTALFESTKPLPTTYSLFPSQPNTPSLPSRAPPPVPRVIPRTEGNIITQTILENPENRKVPPEIVTLTLPPRLPPRSRQTSPARSESDLTTQTPPPRSPLPPLPPSRSGDERSRESSPIPGPRQRRHRPTTNTRKLHGDIKEAVQTDTLAAPTESTDQSSPPQKTNVTDGFGVVMIEPEEKPDVETQTTTESKVMQVELRPRMISPPPDTSRKPLPPTPFPGSEHHNEKPNEKDPVRPMTAQSKRRAAHARRMQRAFTDS
ncbi:hypothetical protein CC80DRAFT_129903 [Byssothecium circinans]|uniref:Uncharacterized protein n=1 Tax=Byssothecium circinans TaxID=147558 RepID=A0A6A5TNG3_9PLEO|nr:hypothetical protein CC80DRAFT_129903 [Byssothecium circinans]